MMNPKIAKLLSSPIYHTHSRILNFEVNYIAIDALRWFIERGMIPSITKKHGMKVKFKTSEQFNEFKMAHPDLKIVES